MATRYRVSRSPRFDRHAKKLTKRHPRHFPRAYFQAIEFLEVDPKDSKSKHPKQIKKLAKVAQGQGQYRLRAGRFRFRYDVYGSTVRLQVCGLRREDTYK